MLNNNLGLVLRWSALSWAAEGFIRAKVSSTSDTERQALSRSARKLDLNPNQAEYVSIFKKISK